jgi:hypothetical protein
MNDLASWKVRGPVRALRKEHAEWDQVSARGRLLEVSRPSRSGMTAKSAKASFTIRTVRSRGGLACTTTPDGSLRRSPGETTGPGAGWSPHNQTDTPICYGVEGAEHAYGVPGAVTLTVAYDDRDLPAEGSFHDANGGLVRRIVFSRDREGRLLTEVAYFGGESPFPELQPHAGAALEERASRAAALKMAFEDQVFCRMVYAYDTKGRLLERTMYMGTLSEERTTFDYDDYDDPIAETSRSRDRRVDVDDDGVVRTTEEEPRVQQHNRYDYQYDSHGNWTERVGSYRIGSQPEFQRSNIERRTITYYELEQVMS